MIKFWHRISFLIVLILLGSVSLLTNAQDASIKINFQLASTDPPEGYVEDYGQAYGVRNGAQQGSGAYSYGWIEAASSTPIDLTNTPSGGANPGIARTRATSQPDLRLRSLAHMDHPNGVEARWEIALPNGEYEIFVSVGDSEAQSSSDSTDNHRINAEGVNIITGHQTTAASGTAARHASGSGIVTITDGKLTIDQNGGGSNTKINYIDITPTGDALSFDRQTLNMIVPINSVASTQVVLTATNNTSYSIDLTGAPSWLSVTGPSTATPGGINVTIDIDTTTGQSIGEQLTHTIVATATDFTSDELDIVVDVISDQLQVNPNDTTPLNGATNVDVNTSVTANFLNTSGGGLDSNLIVTEAMFRLVELDAQDQPVASVLANRNTTGGGDSISLVPTEALKEQTKYRAEVTDQLIDINNDPVIPYSWTFTTGIASGGTIDDVEFEKVNLSDDGGAFWSQLTIGPDGRLYAAKLSYPQAGLPGGIARWDLAANGTIVPNSRVDLNIPQLDDSATVGLIFDPQSTAENPVLYVTSNLDNLSNSANFSGKLVLLSESDAGLNNLNWTYTELVVNLPRSMKDHLSNSLVFGPNGERALYMTQGSISAMGAPDGAWGNRYETVLSAAVLRFDIDSLISHVNTNASAYDVRTDPVSSETAPRLGLGDPNLLYDPQASGALVTLFATGTRNSYDLLWHSNNNLYVPTNGSAGGGNSPGTPNPLPIACENRIDDATNGDYTGPTIPAVNSHPTQRDYLYRIPYEGGTYHGHPNPTRCEWVLNGGNPTSGFDEGEPIGGAKYTVGVQPDRNYGGYAYDFENNKSPNGVIEYKSNTFGGALKGAIIVVRYSGGDDLITLFPDGSNGDINTSYVGSQISGFNGFNNPLDLTEDLRNGNIYVADSNGITLLRPVGSVGVPTPDIVVNESNLVFDQVTDAGASAAKTVTISNIGTANLTYSISVGGADASQFDAQATNLTLLPNASATVSVTFDPASNGPKFATLTVNSNDPDEAQVTVDLAGLGKAGTGGSTEPSLQWILDTFGIGINVDDQDVTTNIINLPGGSDYNDLLGDEIEVTLFERAVDAPVELELLAVYGPTGSNPVVRVGYYTEGNQGSPIQLFDVSNNPSSNGQSLQPPINSGSLTFDPGLNKFGFYSEWPAFGNRRLFQNDAYNTFSGNIPHHVRIYELPGEANAYLVATEEHIEGFDYQDVIYIARNIRPADSSPLPGGIIRLENRQWQFPASADNAGIDHFNSWMAFNTKPTATANGGLSEDLATMRIHNDDTEVLTITGLSFSGTDANNWDLPDGEDGTLPIAIEPGEFLDIDVAFVATGSRKVHRAQLNITSTDPETPSTFMRLGGYWQSQSEGGQEPNVAQISQAFGFGTTIVGPGQQINNGGLLTTIGEEVLSQFWKRADTSKPVYVRQLAAFHSCCGSTATVKIQQNINVASTNNIFTHNASGGQSFLPKINGSSGNPAQNTVTPNNAEFGFQIDPEWSDWTRNNDGPDICGDTPEDDQCGHHVRFWPARDFDGNLIPNAWLMVMDYSGINYDFNDNVYYVTNIQPQNTTFDLVVDNVTESADPAAIGDTILYTFEIENPGLFNSAPGTMTFDVTGTGSFVDAFVGDTAPPEEPEEPTTGPIYRINAGGGAITTPSGNWDASNFFSGGRASSFVNQPILNTTDDLMYQSEWSTNGPNFSFSAPVDNGEYTVRLHFVETWFTGVGSNPTPGAGKRVFDVLLEGNLILDNYDPFVAAGAPLTANVQEFEVTISDGTVTLNFNNAGANNPAISGIEIIGETSGGTVDITCGNNVCDIPAIPGDSSLFVSARVLGENPGVSTIVGTVASPDDTDSGNDSATETTTFYDPSQLPGTITIIKNAVPDGAVEFDFTGDLGAFALTDSGSSSGSGEILQFNFQVDGSPVPNGYLPDYGDAYGAQPTGYTHGWFNLSNNQPIDASGATGAMRDRNRLGIAQELDTIVHFNRGDVATTDFINEIYWELEIPNGDYRVTVSIGDEPGGTGYDSQHQIRIEEQNVFSAPQQLNAGNEYITGSIDVTITDGRLTMDHGNGFNSKANYIIIESLAEPNTITFENQIPATYNVTESEITGWTLVNAVCDDDNSSFNSATDTLSITLDGGEDVTCTFTNTEVGTPVISVEPSELIFSGVKGTTSAAQTVTVTNDGTGVLEITGASMGGTDPSDFSHITTPINLLNGESTTIDVTFTPGANTIGALEAELDINSNAGTATVNLYGLSANAYEGENEPPLALVVETLGYGIDVGWTNLANGTDPNPVGDEVIEPLFQKAGGGDVTILPVARYSPAEALPFGFYIPDTTSTPPVTQVGVLANSLPEAQRLFPTVATGGTTFDPGSVGFGIYVHSLGFGRFNYTEDSLNTDGVAHRVRIYPMADREGTPIPNSYLIAFEDASNGDYQDYVFVLSNVEPYDPNAVVSCVPMSTLGCEDIPVTLPFVLDWANDEGGLVDNANVGTGFTMVDPPSARISADDPVSFPNVPGYEPGQLDVDITGEGTLTITANKGIQYSQLPSSGNPNSANTNSLINGLGVGIDASSEIINIETTIANLDFTPSTGNTNSPQAGIWFGLHEDQYVKLVIIRTGANAGRIQLMVEDVVNNTTSQTAFRELNGAAISNLSSQTVDLRLMVDPTLGMVAGFYSLDGGTTEIQLENNTLSLPAFYTNGVDHDSNVGTPNVSYAGIYATYRNADTSYQATFTDFSITTPNAAPDTTLAGTIDLDYRPDESSVINVTFYTVGSDSEEFPATPFTADSFGSFLISGLTAGSYDVAVKPPLYLQVIETVTLVEGANSVNFGTFIAGDANGDNQISILDFSFLSGHYGTTSPEADLNGDGLVSILDFSIMSANYGAVGDAPGTP